MPKIRDASQPPRAFLFALFNASADDNGIAAAEGGALWTGGYVPLDERKSWERIRGGPFLPAPDSLTGPEHGLVKCCDFKTTCNGSRQLSIEHSSPDRWGTAALDSANYS
jgi:hypothetical protein